MNDSVDLLKAEIAKEEALLASETKALQEMDKNARRAEAERKRQTKNVREGITNFDSMLMISSRNTLCFGSSMHFLGRRALHHPTLRCWAQRRANQRWMR